ncbi:MAG: zinc-dependent metalloprotease [Phycisphaerales bacterium]|nr:zinc-dependent metalloprotease [Phycisphaerales bacterium]
MRANLRANYKVLSGVVGSVIGLGALVAGSSMAMAVEPYGAGPEESIDFAAMAAMAAARGGGGAAKPDKEYKDWKDVSKGFTKVVSTADGSSFYSLYVNNKTNQVLAELPRGYAKQHHFFAMTVAGGEVFAGLQAGDRYTQWRKVGKRLMLVQPQISVRSSGDQESKDSVEMIWTDRVILDVPIVTMGPGGQPVIDLDSLLVGQAGKFFGRRASGLNPSLTVVNSIKAFPKNIEVQFKGPVANGTMKTFHYSISNIKGSKGFKPRMADERVGYFVTNYTDLGKFDWTDTSQRMINRWNIQKADPKLSMSPPKEPIVYYIDHTVPVRYRRYVKQGIEYWNEAFRDIGIDGAIQVQYQDKTTGANMDKDPEDVRYNFIRWISNDIATAIGPSRVNPMTGEILDADVVLTDGWIRVFTYRWEDLLSNLALEGMSPETMGWLEANPKWDPRLRLASPSRREQILIERAQHRSIGMYGGRGISDESAMMIGDDEFDGLGGRTSQVSGMCEAATGKALDLAMMRMNLSMVNMLNLAAEMPVEPDADADADAEMLDMVRKMLAENPEMRALIPAEQLAMLEKADAKDEDEDEVGDEDGEGGDDVADEKKEEGDMIDGVPEWFVGPMLAELVAHEVGHTLGLRHNFKGSSVYSLEDINSEEIKGNKPWSSTVMDYNGINIKMPGSGEIQGDYSVVGIGEYDRWAIEYGYGTGDLKKVLSRAAEPMLDYGTDEDTWGPDPRSRRYDLAENPIDYAHNQMKLVKAIRGSLLDGFVKDGDSWSRVRRGYSITLGTQMQSLSMMSNWVGSAYVSRTKKGDPDGQAPIQVVPVERQRAAIEFVIDNAFEDDAYGITPELLAHASIDKWWDNFSGILADSAFQIHDRVLGMQASALTMLLNPQTVARVYDYEMFVPADEDALTVAELMETVTGSVWSELDEGSNGRYTVRKPMISSLRRNLQREHLDRLIDMSMNNDGFNSASMMVKTLASMHLRELKETADGVVESSGGIDAYTKAHLQEVSVRIEKALDADYIYNTEDISSGGVPWFLFGQDGQSER